jgi:hypothetical protein
MGATSAWLFSTDLRENEIGVRKLFFDTRLIEDFDAPTGSAPAESGKTVAKEAWVRNDGDIPAFVRVMVFPTLRAADGKTFLDAHFGAELSFIGLDTSQWKDGGDGWFYYLGVLQPGQSTPSLFEAVTLDPGIENNAYPHAALTVTLLCETVETGKWHYRQAWWNNPGGTGLTGSLALVDGALSALAR